MATSITPTGPSSFSGIGEILKSTVLYSIGSLAARQVVPFFVEMGPCGLAESIANATLNGVVTTGALKLTKTSNGPSFRNTSIKAIVIFLTTISLSNSYSLNFLKSWGFQALTPEGLMLMGISHVGMDFCRTIVAKIGECLANLAHNCSCSQDSEV